MSAARDRLREVREMLELNQRELAEKIGVTPQLISQMEAGKTPVSAATARALEDEAGVSAAWLIYGRGEMVSERANRGKTLGNQEITPTLTYFPAVTKTINKIAGKMNLADWQALNSFCMRILQKEADNDHTEY